MASAQPEIRESGYVMDVYQNIAKRRESEYLFKREDDVDEAPRVEIKSSEYQLKPLRALQPVRTASNYSYFDPKDESNLPADDESIVRANLISHKDLVKRVKNLKGGYYIPTIIDSQLYFVRSNDDDLKTASPSPSLTDVRDLDDEDEDLKTCRSPSLASSESSMKTAINSQALTTSKDHIYNTAVTGVFTARSASGASNVLTTCQSSEPFTALSFASERTALDGEPSSYASTAKSFASECTATDRDMSISSGYDAFSDYEYGNPTSDVQTAREIRDVDRQNFFRQMGYKIHSELVTRLPPRLNASSTEVTAKGLAKTPSEFDEKVSEYGKQLGRQASNHSVTGTSNASSAYSAASQESSQFDI